MTKKSIDELYQEKFSGFTPLPEEHVWEGISSSLDHKRKKRLLPIWLSGGIAAAIALILYFGNINTNRSISIDQTQITDSQQEGNTNNSTDKESGTPIVDKAEEIEITSSSTLEDIDQSVAKEEVRFSNTDQYVSQDEVQNAAPEPKANKVLVAENIFENTEEVVDSNSNGNKIPEDYTLDDASRITDLNKKIEENVTDVNTVVAENNSDDKKSIFETLEENEATDEDEKTSKWSVGPSVASVYYDGFGEGSPIDASFAQNGKSGDFNLSYGLQVSYELSKKLSVRSGVHRVNYGYNTDDILFSSSLDASSAFKTIDYNENSQNIVVVSKSTSQSLQDSFSENAVRDEFTAKSPQRDGTMIQELGYLEIPLELNYRLVDNRFGVSLSGGLSSLFLVDNTISLESEGNITEMGEANNVNGLNFSTNIGLGLDYKFLPNMKLTVEPMLKYQLNTFSNTTGDFNPYALGIYSGIWFKF